MKNNHFKNSLLVVLGCFFLVFSSDVSGKTESWIPETLQPWVQWVLHGKENHVNGIPEYNSSDQRHISFPTKLSMQVDETGALFTQEWNVTSECWCPLPGGDPSWPVDVRLNGSPVVAIKRGDKSCLKLVPGNHRVTGKLVWSRLPEHVPVPVDTALIELMIHNEPVEFPRLDGNGRLWFHVERDTDTTLENRLSIQSYRLIKDGIPAIQTILLKLDVAGAAREVVLGPVFSGDAFVPVSLNSRLPARIDTDGRLTLQLKPGQWNLEITARHLGPLMDMTFHLPDDGYWPRESIWSFQQDSTLRMVEITGVPAIDPQQTMLPDSWRQFAAYRMTAGDTMVFNELKRGDPEPAPDQLTLKRKMWLRYDGSGYTLQDQITGQKNNDWRLEINPPVTLGKVEVDGEIQFITRLKDSDKQGVEIRQGNVLLTADSELKNQTTCIPLSGWDQPFQNIHTELVLPPGYRLIHVAGVDNAPMTWLSRWNLLDLFFVLLLTAAVSKLFNWRKAILTFVTLGLLIHESSAPVWIWLAIIIGVALLRYLPDGTFRNFIKIYQITVVTLLALIAVPFAATHIRTAIYPQLEMSRYVPMMDQFMGYDATAMPEDEEGFPKPALPVQQTRGYSSDVYSSLAPSSNKLSRGRPNSAVAQYDPRMVNQTGPGLPDWSWKSITMWTGPTEPGQKLTLILTGPVTNGILAFLRVFLLILLAGAILDARYSKGSGWSAAQLKSLAFKTGTAVIFMVLFLGLNSAHAGAPPDLKPELPSPTLLQELERRLTEPDDCFPYCADVEQMALKLRKDKLTIDMTIHAAIDTVIPLPGAVQHWIPGKIKLDNREITALYRQNNVIWAMVPEGIHQMTLSGPLPGYATIQLPLHLKPAELSMDAAGWTVEGIRKDGALENQLQFTRLMTRDDHGMETMESNVLPPFVEVRRKLMLGLEWRVETLVTRMSPREAAIALDIPLLTGESVITDGLEVRDGTVRINLDASRDSVLWESVLDPADVIQLHHPETSQWTEIWEVDVSPILHMEYHGIPVIMRQRSQRWFPQWHPWPGETLELHLSRPEGVPGQTLTVQRSLLTVTPGKRVTDCTLKLVMQSSQGMQHTIKIPADARVQSITIDNKEQPIRQEGREIPLSIKPGVQTIQVAWREKSQMKMLYKTPEVDLGIRNVNASISVNIPRNRWMLWLMGPQMGPAVLFWNLLIVILIVAWILSRTGWTPLKFHHWVILALGMSQGGLLAIAIITGWLIVMHFRQKLPEKSHPTFYNFVQVVVVGATFIAMTALIIAISSGLLGHPDMSIAGNGSSRMMVKWYQDVSGNILPAGTVFSLPIFLYRVAMLLWALWTSFFMISIVKWAWKQFSTPVLWLKTPLKK